MSELKQDHAFVKAGWRYWRHILADQALEELPDVFSQNLILHGAQGRPDLVGLTNARKWLESMFASIDLSTLKTTFDPISISDMHSKMMFKATISAVKKTGEPFEMNVNNTWLFQSDGKVAETWPSFDATTDKTVTNTWVDAAGK